MLGRVPTLVGALGAVARGRKPQTYKFLAIRLGVAFTHAPRCSPFWEAFGYPVERIINYAIPTADEGLLTFQYLQSFGLTPLEEKKFWEQTGEIDRGVPCRSNLERCQM